MNVSLNTKGETILETVIAFIILASGVVFVGMIMGSSLKNVDNSRNRIVAINVAREGIEAVRNIRDTNWLRFNGKRRACWNHFPGKNLTDPCTGATPIAPGNYIVYKQKGTLQWRLFDLADSTISTANVAPANPVQGAYYRNTTDNKTYFADSGQWQSLAKLYLVDIDPTIDSDSDGDLTNDADIYNHLFPKDDLVAGDLSATTLLERIITIEYLDNAGNIIDSTAWLAAAKKEDFNRMRVTSTVSWVRNGQRFTVELATHLTDYLDRDRLEG